MLYCEANKYSLSPPPQFLNKKSSGDKCHRCCVEALRKLKSTITPKENHPLASGYLYAPPDSSGKRCSNPFILAFLCQTLRWAVSHPKKQPSMTTGSGLRWCPSCHLTASKHWRETESPKVTNENHSLDLILCKISNSRGQRHYTLHAGSLTAAPKTDSKQCDKSFLINVSTTL